MGLREKFAAAKAAWANPKLVTYGTGLEQALGAYLGCTVVEELPGGGLAWSPGIRSYGQRSGEN